MIVKIPVSGHRPLPFNPIEVFQTRISKRIQLELSIVFLKKKVVIFAAKQFIP